jgi:hypothetical protein
MLVAKALKIELNLKVIELSKGDNKTPEFLKVQYEILVLHVLPDKQLIRVNCYRFYVPQGLEGSVTTVFIASSDVTSGNTQLINSQVLLRI